MRASTSAPAEPRGHERGRMDRGAGDRGAARAHARAEHSNRHRSASSDSVTARPNVLTLDLTVIVAGLAGAATWAGTEDLRSVAGTGQRR